MKKIQLTSKKEVYNFSEPYVIAEIGANHNGDMELARIMIDAAKEAGADCAKFQSWTSKSLVSTEEYNRNQSYDDSPKKHFGSLKQMFERYELNNEQHYELKDYCEKVGIDFCSTPFSYDEADLLRGMDVPFIKVASMDVNNPEFLAYVAGFGKPVVLSTGMSTLAEIDRAVTAIEKAGNSEIVLLHCIAIYPPALEDIHLRNITMLQQTFGYPVGFSDHSIGFSIPLASVALGACIIEKHFTTDKDLPGWDHEISADPYEMKVICEESKKIITSLGSFRRTVSEAEMQKKAKFRRSLVLKRDLAAGEVITREVLTAKRPGTKIAPDEIQYVLGRKVKHDLPADHVVDWTDLD